MPRKKDDPTDEAPVEEPTPADGTDAEPAPPEPEPEPTPPVAEEPPPARVPAVGDYVYLHGRNGGRVGGLVIAVTAEGDDYAPYVNAYTAEFGVLYGVPARQSAWAEWWWEWIAAAPDPGPPRPGPV